MVAGALLFSGCSILNTSSEKSIGGVMKSVDSGITWEFKNKVNEKKSIAGVDVLQMAIDPVDTQKIYLGTRKKGIAFSDDGAESWVKMKFPATNVYGLAINRYRPGTIYASGSYRKRGKVFKTTDYGKKWEEVYTEPAAGTNITAMAISENNPHILYLGTSEGNIIKTVDDGKTWRKLYTAKALISQIAFGDGSDDIVYFVSYKNKLLATYDGGSNFEELDGRNVSDENNFSDNVKNSLKESIKNSLVYSIGVDRSEGVRKLYVGTNNGLFRSDDRGKSFVKLDILSDPKKYPIRAIAINPKNSQEIIYTAAQAIYRSNDFGKHWATFQLDTQKVVGNVRFDPEDVNLVYVGLRSFGK